MQSALAFYGLIPDTVHSTVSVTAGRPERLETPLGVFEYRHVQPALLRGYRMTNLGDQQALAAIPEKELLDLVYLQPGGDSEEYIQELRLQNLDQLHPDVLRAQATIFNKPKIYKAVEVINRVVQNEAQDYESL